MTIRTLITDRHYFGLEAVKLRSSAGRVMTRVVGLPPERAHISAQNLLRDFGLDAEEGATLVERLVASGFLQPLAEGSEDYCLTDRFAQLASARVVEPLPRTRAKLLLVEAASLAERINRNWLHNPLEIVSFAVYGDYMLREPAMDALRIGVKVRSRTPGRRTRFRRVSTKPEGAEQVRDAFKGLSTFIRVRLVMELQDLPRPFRVVYEADLPA